MKTLYWFIAISGVIQFLGLCMLAYYDQRFADLLTKYNEVIGQLDDIRHKFKEREPK